jgi:hypothetical protein
MTAEQLQLVSDMLTEVARTLAIISIAQRLSEASSEHEKMFLSQALSNLISTFAVGKRLGRNPQMGMEFEQQIY